MSDNAPSPIGKLLWGVVVFLLLNAIFVFLFSLFLLGWWVFPGKAIIYSIDVVIASAVLTILPVFGMWYGVLDEGYGMSWLFGGWAGGAILSIALAFAKVLTFMHLVAPLNLEHSVVSFPLAGGLVGAISVTIFVAWQEARERKKQEMQEELE